VGKDELEIARRARVDILSQDATSTPADDYMPHLSLAYGGKGAEAILSDLRKNTLRQAWRRESRSAVGRMWAKTNWK
jgi:hypothetical protein